MEIERADGAVVGGWMVLGVVIPPVVGTLLPVDFELSLANAIADPVKAHVNGFGSLLFHFVIDDAFCAGVVSLNGSWRLRVS